MKYFRGVLALTLVCATSLLFCSESHCDCGGDAGNPCNGPTPVLHGASCTADDDAGACGYAASCGHVGSYNAVTTCSCTNGRWNCDTQPCPQCPDPTIIKGACASPATWCAGPTHAQRCDGVLEDVEADAGCQCTASGWQCDGVANLACDDAAVDAASD